MRRRRATLASAAASVLVAIIVACGGGGGSAAFDGATVRSDDGVLTLEVPAGAAADGVEIEVARIADSALPAVLQGADGAVVLGYELGPDGTQFSEPVALTFRVDPAEHGLNLPEGAVPPGLLLTQSAGGDLESIEGAQVSYEDGEVVVRATVMHFTPAILMLSNNVVVELVPAEIELVVGGSKDVEVITHDVNTDAMVALPHSLFSDETAWTTTAPFTVVRSDRLKATISCTAPTDDWVEDAYSVMVPTYFTAFFDEQAEFYGTIVGLSGVVGAFGAPLGLRLAGDGKCSGSASTTSPPSGPTSAPPPPPQPRSSTNTSYPVVVSGASGSVEVNTNDCFGAEGPLDQCPPEVDIAGMSWEPVDGSPHLLLVTVRFEGPFTAPTDTTVDIPIRGREGTPLGTRVRLAGGDVTCTFPGSAGPLAGESCEVNAAGEIELVRDVSGLTGKIRISIRSIQGAGDSPVQDAVQIMGIQRP